ncbi:MAG TPA: hypothetical protein VEX86_27985, partial [Longimicrobium sp.]|nr:hypothetical protein [Longimicrobium sp.]
MRGSVRGAARALKSEAPSLPRLLDLDLESFFDSVPHDLVLRAVARHTDLRFVLLYVERWLKAPLQLED